MKSKQIKLLRKKLEKANKAGYDLPEGVTTKLVFGSDNNGKVNGMQKEEEAVNATTNDDPAVDAATGATTTTTVTIQSWSPNEFQKSNLLPEFMKLFEENMGEQYRQSSWGLNLEDKQQELQHKKARFLVALADSNNDGDDGNSGNNKLAGFCHYRFDYNDEDEPDEVVLYVYELQIHETFRRKGLGQLLMQIVETIAQRNNNQAQINKVMLTVFKCNQSAMHFYQQKLNYAIDEISPSRCDVPNSDYEILSKQFA